MSASDSQSSVLGFEFSSDHRLDLFVGRTTCTELTYLDTLATSQLIASCQLGLSNLVLFIISVSNYLSALPVNLKLEKLSARPLSSAGSHATP